MVWLRQLLRELGCDDLIAEPTLVFGDNKQANTLVREAIVTSGNQYIYLPYHFNKEAQALGYVDVLSVKTALNVADLFTKPAPAAKIRDLMGQMLGYTPIDYAEVLNGKMNHQPYDNLPSKVQLAISQAFGLVRSSAGRASPLAGRAFDGRGR